MKRVKIIILCLFLFVSCASIKYNPESGEISYFRIGDQQIQGFEVNKEADELEIKLNKQQSKTDALKSIIHLLETLTVP